MDQDTKTGGVKIDIGKTGKNCLTGETIEADKADRKAYVLKKKVSKEAGEVDHSEILLRTAKERLRCPHGLERFACGQVALSGFQIRSGRLGRSGV